MNKFFPFSQVREGQKQFMEDVALAVNERKHLLADAPAGIGKTAAVLSATLEYALEHNKTVFFVTPRHSQHRMAIDTLKQIAKTSGTDITAVDIIGKKWLCSQPVYEYLSSSDFSEFCKSKRKKHECAFYNRTKDGTKLTPGAFGCLSVVRAQGPLHAEQLKELTQRFCTFEMAVRLISEADVVVSDYYHIFSSAREQLLGKAEKKLDDVILVVDEAHNLPNRIIKLLSRRLTSIGLRAAYKESIAYAPEVADYMQQLNSVLQGIYTKEERFVEKSELVEELHDYDELVVQMQDIGEEIRAKKQKSSIGSVGDFLDMWRKDFNGFTRIVSEDRGRSNRPYIALSYDCLDPALLSRDILDSVHACICMSGTLKPAQMYIDLLGFDKSRTRCAEYTSPFPTKNRLDLLIPDVTTKYENRCTDEYMKFGDYISRCVNAIRGNVAVFFPSYRMLGDIVHYVRTEKTMFIEEPEMSKSQKADFYDNFVKNQNAVLAGVQAGSFGEGVDFPGLNLNGVIIVGLSLERPTLKTKSLISYYDGKFGRGWEYAYSYPAVQRAIQSAGRCIRSEIDRGVCVFMDKRFGWLNYKRILPVNMQIKATTEPEKHIKEFFSVDK
ncbi:MAG: ATP-dependent DNA helicase [Candidatus Aenigmatarchaeota archaeon]